ncbi:MAG: class I SAM-dependent methyltransferase [Methanoregula sp.]|nr:class I SAM-dependent methyltransferase [Methanoregula sp.]
MQEWDGYWAKDQQAHNRIYDKIAVFYRRYIIKPYLKKYFSKYFLKKLIILHAGCGGGQVEEGIIDSQSVIGLDISVNALTLYRKNHCDSPLILGDISKISIRNESLDGIYNLGVMEHFSEEQINHIFLEFHRILKKNGKIILFWPPRYGTTVIFLKCVHYFFNSLLGKKIQLHPLEPSLIRSKKQVEKIVQLAGFKLKEYNFSLADFYTYAVIVLEKAD